MSGIHLCGDEDLTKIISFCFTGFRIKLLSVIPEKKLIFEIEKSREPKFPDLKFGELIMIVSLENQNLITDSATIELALAEARAKAEA